MHSELPKELRDKGLQYACTDLGNRDRFVRDHADKALFIAEQKAWAVWDGSRWKTDEANAHRLAVETVRSIYDEAKTCENGQGQVALSKWALQSQAEAKIRAMQNLAAKALNASIAEFDADAYVLNCKNGIVDLKSGQLRQRTSNDRVMKIARADYIPTAEAKRWDYFLDQILMGDQELRHWLHKYLGYTLTGSVREQCFVILYGRGRNGKGVLCETLLHVLGDYARPTNFDIFLSADRNVRTMEAIGDLQGIRFALASETDSTKKWSEALMKQLTGGDTLKGAKLYGQQYDFEPTFKLFFQVNHLPGFKDASLGFKSRLRVIPFNAEFTGDKQDKNLKDELLSERDGILAWLVEGARLYFAEGLDEIPKAIRDATDEYIGDNDVLTQFVDERLEPDPAAVVGSQESFGAYVSWCHENGHNAPATQKLFKDGMVERSIPWKKTNKGNVFVGYRLRTGTLRLDVTKTE